jgi:hypothetical protein
MVESPNDADPEDQGSPMEPDSKGRRRLLIPAATEDARFIATLGPAERAEFLSHHYKLQQVEQLADAEAQAFRGCAWRGGLYCAGFTLAAGSSLVRRSRLLSGVSDWVHEIVGWLGMIGALLCLGAFFPAILGFFRWVFAMRDRRRLGREMVMPAATFESREGEKGRDGGL